MAEITEEMPLVVIQPGKMLTSWKSIMKYCLVMLICAAICWCLYIYMNLFLLKIKKLEMISIKTLETDKMMHNLYVTDRNMAMDLEDISSTYYQQACQQSHHSHN